MINATRPAIPAALPLLLGWVAPNRDVIMESFFWYKGYGIRYEQLGGNTYVEDCGMVLKSFLHLGMVGGEYAAMAFIDKLTEGAK